MAGHILKDCPLIPKIGEIRTLKMKKDDKKEIVAASSDSETSEIESNEEHMANICVITK